MTNFAHMGKSCQLLAWTTGIQLIPQGSKFFIQYFRHVLGIYLDTFNSKLKNVKL